MKCIILAGGKGERLWPLSRKDFPKQFIQIQKNHSIFQETIARNMAYCDEFIIVTNYDYRFIVANQMQVFQGVSYRCIFEEIPRHTTAATALASMELQPSEYVFVTSASHLIDTGDCKGVSYKDAMLKAKILAGEGRIVLFGRETNTISGRYGYFAAEEGLFIEKPDSQEKADLENKEVYQNLGVLIYQNGTFLNELKYLQRDTYENCRNAFANRKAISGGVLYEAKELSSIRPVSVERSIIEATTKKSFIKTDFGWSDISRLEDLEKTDIQTGGTEVINGGSGNTIINRSSDKAIVINEIDDVIAVNTPDAIYIGRKGESYRLRDIIHDHSELETYTERSATVYRSWGYYEDLAIDPGYRVRKATVLPGRTIYEHAHDHRCENWTIIRGTALITIEDNPQRYGAGDTAVATPGMRHQISNTSEGELVFIETATGDLINDSDMRSVTRADLTEMNLGMKLDPMIKLTPAYKDYLWGGTRLREVYNKKCDYDTIAESWELSAHPAGSSIVASGRHKGLSFARYLEVTGREVLGWKCAHMQAFPVLIKFIDAKNDLSVQVHPDDDYALSNETEFGKNEMWYVVDTEPGAGLYVGFEHDVSREEIAARIENKTIMEVLNFYPTKPGDIFFIPAGTVHAIGAGNLICEIQQSSNCTYRLYDYGRIDKFGNPRELHLEKALDVLDYSKYEPAELDIRDTEACVRSVRCKYFKTAIYEIDGMRQMILDEESFHSVVCIKGSGTIRLKDMTICINAGDSVFIPATADVLETEGKLSLIITKI